MTGVSPQVLGAHAFLRGMTAGQVALLAGTAAEVSVPHGFRFFEEGGAADRFWLISSGHVALDLQLPGRARLIVETVGGGGVIGLSWLSPPREWQFGAARPSGIPPPLSLTLPRSVRACDGDPALGVSITRQLMAVAATRLQATRIRLLDLYATAGPARWCPMSRCCRRCPPSTGWPQPGRTDDTVTLALRPVDQPIAAHQPGQFTMLYAFGVGEVPISISGPADGTDLVQTIRSVGAVTRALCAAGPGQMIGVRGPYGTGWEVEAAAGQDVVLVAGGIGLAPLRPALLSLLAARERFRRITVLIGARSPAEVVFAGELASWRDRGADVHLTVDRAVVGWTGHVGVVTQLIDRADMDAAATLALLCGPEVMMRLAARDLRARGVPPESIRVSLERNVRCGIAECGHCQLGPLLLCRDGPVVSYQRAAPLLAVQEL